MTQASQVAEGARGKNTSKSDLVTQAYLEHSWPRAEVDRNLSSILPTTVTQASQVARGACGQNTNSDPGTPEALLD